MTEPNRTNEERIELLEGHVGRLEAELKNLADVVIQFQAEAGKALDRRIVVSTLPPELQVRPSPTSSPTRRLARSAPRAEPDIRGKFSGEHHEGKRARRQGPRGSDFD